MVGRDAGSDRGGATGRVKIGPDDLAYAFDCAADFLEQEEWPEDDGGVQVAAYREAARRIRRMAARIGRAQKVRITRTSAERG